ncbi:MAG: alcohol dehydrogenase catalytic domain-containing protein [Candidatus Poribacteria bacterium]|nr:alcohol dehydrogenase catalytic domain-containing protein [Candidatus Poribacteria bacterium]MDE0505075.1 alcohol dehydrogenase catalytic domain-containing protein [Candidatus Poribacteria bacterium]
MKAAVFEQTGKLSIQDKPIPNLASGDVLIKVDLCGVCASDLAALHGDVTDYSPPVVMGHELAGIVVDSRRSDVKVGEKVTVNPMLSCGTCEYCRADLDKYCEEIEGIGHDIDGGYAEYIRMPKHGVDTEKLISVPDAIPAEDLLFLEPLGCCLNAMRETMFDKSVAILGAGPIGLLFAQLTKKKGLQTFVLEPLVHRRDAAEKLGVDAAIDITEKSIGEMIETTSGGVDTVISATTNNMRAIDLAFKVVRRGGCINFFGLAPAGQEIRVNLEHFHYMGHKLMASWAFSRWSLNESRRLLLDHELQFTPLLTDRYPIEKAVEAFENARNRRGVKSVLAGP